VALDSAKVEIESLKSAVGLSHEAAIAAELVTAAVQVRTTLAAARAANEHVCSFGPPILWHSGNVAKLQVHSAAAAAAAGCSLSRLFD
jgi:hypothetical protein